MPTLAGIRREPTVGSAQSCHSRKRSLSRDRTTVRAPHAKAIARALLYFLLDLAAEREQSLVDFGGHLAYILHDASPVLEYPRFPEEIIAQLVDFGLIGRGCALQPLQVDRVGANLLGSLALFSGNPLEAHHDRRALCIEGVEQAREQELSGRNLGRRAGQEFLDVLFGFLEGSPPCRQFR